MLKVQFDKANPCFRPGETISATIVWSFEQVPKSFLITVGWQTQGKGNEDSLTVHSETWPGTTTSGEREFKFTLPRGPISFAGQLINLGWMITCDSKKPNESVIVPFLLSMTDRQARLPKIAAK